MERLDPTLWKEPGTARGRIAIIAYRRCRYPCGHGSCRSWYRCSRRQSSHQLPDGKYHRGLRPSYRCVFLNLVFLTGPIDGVCPFCLGRTGRAGKQGIAITFLTNDDDEVMCVKFSLLRLLFVGNLFFFFPFFSFRHLFGSPSCHLISGYLDVHTDFRIYPDRYDLKQGTPDVLWTDSVSSFTDRGVIGNRDIEESRFESTHRACEARGRPTQGLEGNEEKERCRGSGLRGSNIFLYYYICRVTVGLFVVPSKPQYRHWTIQELGLCVFL